MYIVWDVNSGEASIVTFTIVPKLRITSYDKKGFPKRQVVEYHLVIDEIALGRDIIGEIIAKISKLE